MRAFCFALLLFGGDVPNFCFLFFTFPIILRETMADKHSSSEQQNDHFIFGAAASTCMSHGRSLPDPFLSPEIRSNTFTQTRHFHRALVNIKATEIKSALKERGTEAGYGRTVSMDWHSQPTALPARTICTDDVDDIFYLQINKRLLQLRSIVTCLPE